MTIHTELFLIALCATLSCALPGIFLVLRGVALMADAMSHSVLLGITIMFLITQTIHSPFLLIGAVCMGMITVVCTELLISTKCLKKDMAIGLIFPLFFSIAVLLISLYAKNVHLDTDMVLLGDLAFAPFNRLIFNGGDVGPWALWMLLGTLCLNVIFIATCYKELALSIFDPEYAQSIGIKVSYFYYGLMLITSITAVAAFDVVGAVVVVALMIIPASCAIIVSKDLFSILFLTALFSICAAWGGYLSALALDVSIAGSIATVAGLIFSLVFFARF